MTSLADEMKIASLVASHLAAAGITEEDPDFADLMSSECEVLERLKRILRAARYTEGQSKALAEILADNRERKSRLDTKAERLRSVVLQAMQELGLKKLEAPDLTASVGAGRPKVTITDEAALPDDVCVFARTPDKRAIAAWIAEKPCPGAEMSNAQPTLTVRSK